MIFSRFPWGFVKALSVRDHRSGNAFTEMHFSVRDRLSERAGPEQDPIVSKGTLEEPSEILGIMRLSYWILSEPMRNL